jgi:Ca2+-binding RTX toxin-like protein
MVEQIGLTRGASAEFDLRPAFTAKTTDASVLTGGEFTPPTPDALILIGDSVPGDTSSTVTLTVGGAHLIGTTETIGDQDFYRVTLVAGQSYEIGMFGKAGGPNLIPQADSYVEIYDAAGNLIVSGDGGASTLYNNINSGFDVLLSFTPETSGTYFVNARAFDQDATNGTDGDTIGDYEIFVQPASLYGYRPYYDIDSPLYSIDWGSQVDGSSRNPDGQEGPRVTGNDFTGVGWNPYGITGKNVITYYFAREGEVFIDEDPTTPGTTDTIVAAGFEDWEKGVYLNAFGAYSNVADIVYVEVSSRAQADFVLITYSGTPGTAGTPSLLGRMSPPDEENEGRTEFNSNDIRWTEEGLAPGGFSFTTLIHELGHGHGLAHPHDAGGHSGVMHGVEQESATSVANYTNGDFDLNQSVYTMMSYEDGWEKSPYGQAETTDGFGWLGTLMAFDVAAIQDKYGVNENYRTGDDMYVLNDVNAAGTYFSCIWDAGGNDAIVYSGARDANIDLRPATLQYEYGGGGWISYAYGVFGGFTIANGVTIETAVGGGGNDVLIGNGSANTLIGSGGNDRMEGGAGNDSYRVEQLGDLVVEAAGGGSDGVYVALGLGSYTLNAGSEVEIVSAIDTAANVTFNLTGNEYGNTLIGTAGSNTLIGGGGNDILVGGAGHDYYRVEDAGDAVLEYAGGGYDAVYVAGLSAYTLQEGYEIELLSVIDPSATNAVNLTGNSLSNTLYGGAGANVLDGKGGADTLVGLAGADIFAFTTFLGGTNADLLTGFEHNNDKIALDDAIFSGIGGLGALGANAFVAGTAAQDADDRIIYNQANGQLLFDADGSGAGAAVLFATIQGAPTLSASDFQVI